MLENCSKMIQQSLCSPGRTTAALVCPAGHPLARWGILLAMSQVCKRHKASFRLCQPFCPEDMGPVRPMLRRVLSAEGYTRLAAWSGPGGSAWTLHWHILDCNQVQVGVLGRVGALWDAI